MPDLDIVIVNWNSGDHLRSCLSSFAEAGRVELRVTIVDNASSDGSADHLPPGSYSLDVIRNATNSGFSRACNQGARTGRTPFILFLNPDCRVERAALDRLVDYMRSAAEDRIGVVGVQLRDETQHVSVSCSRTPKALHAIGRAFAFDRLMPGVVPPHFRTDWDHRDSRDVEQVMGAFYCVPRRIFEELNGFDERFFVYYEEVDFAKRAADAGYRVRFLADIPVVHIGCGTTDSIPAARQYYITRSAIQYAWKHFNPFAAATVTVANLLVEPVVRMLGFASRGRMRDVRASANAARMLWSSIPTMISSAQPVRDRASLS